MIRLKSLVFSIVLVTGCSTTEYITKCPTLPTYTEQDTELLVEELAHLDSEAVMIFNAINEYYAIRKACVVPVK